MLQILIGLAVFITNSQSEKDKIELPVRYQYGRAHCKLHQECII